MLQTLPTGRGDTKKAGPAHLRLLLRLVPEPRDRRPLGALEPQAPRPLGCRESARSTRPSSTTQKNATSARASSPRWAPTRRPTTPLLRRTSSCSLRKANVGVAVVSWYPPGKRDANGPEVDGLVKRLLAAAARFGLELCLHLEPWEGRTAAAQLKDVAYAVRTYGAHDAYHKIDGKCVFFAYDSYQLAARDGARRGPRRTTARSSSRWRWRRSTSTTTSAARAASTGPTVILALRASRKLSTPSSWKGPSHAHLRRVGSSSRASRRATTTCACDRGTARIRGPRGGGLLRPELARGDRERRGARRRGHLSTSGTRARRSNPRRRRSRRTGRASLPTLAYPSPEFYLTKTAAWVEHRRGAKRRARGWGKAFSYGASYIYDPDAISEGVAHMIFNMRGVYAGYLAPLPYLQGAFAYADYLFA